MWKVIQSHQLLVSHQMRIYSIVTALCGSSYNCITATWVLRQYETGPEYPKSYTGRNTWKVNQSLLTSLFHIKWDLTLVSRPPLGWVIPVLQVLKYWDNLGKLGLNTPNNVQGHMKSNPKSSAPHQIKSSHQVPHQISFYSSV